MRTFQFTRHHRAARSRRNGVCFPPFATLQSLSARSKQSQPLLYDKAALFWPTLTAIGMASIAVLEFGIINPATGKGFVAAKALEPPRETALGAMSAGRSAQSFNRTDLR